MTCFLSCFLQLFTVCPKSTMPLWLKYCEDWTMLSLASLQPQFCLTLCCHWAPLALTAGPNWYPSNQVRHTSVLFVLLSFNSLWKIIIISILKFEHRIRKLLYLLARRVVFELAADLCKCLQTFTMVPQNPFFCFPGGFLEKKSCGYLQTMRSINLPLITPAWPELMVPMFATRCLSSPSRAQHQHCGVPWRRHRPIKRGWVHCNVSFYVHSNWLQKQGGGTRYIYMYLWIYM